VGQGEIAVGMVQWNVALVGPKHMDAGPRDLAGRLRLGEGAKNTFRGASTGKNESDAGGDTQSLTEKKHHTVHNAARQSLGVGKNSKSGHPPVDH
jgi:hypothetical protein